MRIFFSVLLFSSLGACAVNRGVDVIPYKLTAQAQADVKNQLLDYQNHMEWLAQNPEQDPVLVERKGKSIICGRPGGIRLDITQAVATMTMQTSLESGIGGSRTGDGPRFAGGVFGIGSSRTGTVTDSYAVKIAEQRYAQKGATTPLARALLDRRNSFIESQYRMQDLGRGCIQWIPHQQSNVMTMKLVRARKGNAGPFFTLGDVMLGPSLGRSRTVENTLVVNYALSYQTPSASDPQAGASGGASDKDGTILMSNGVDPKSLVTISVQNGISMVPEALFPDLSN